ISNTDADKSTDTSDSKYDNSRTHREREKVEKNVMTSPSHYISSLLSSAPSTLVTSLPSISSIQPSTSGLSSATLNTITISEENFTRDLIVWFRDIQSSKTEFRSKKCMVCLLPEELMYEMEHQNNIKRDINLQSQHLQHLSNGRVGIARRPIG
ncbi:9784_t:CDS:2, partial [Acaulospora morrowiae]